MKDNRGGRWLVFGLVGRLPLGHVGGGLHGQQAGEGLFLGQWDADVVSRLGDTTIAPESEPTLSL
jgi:hypothetical protein